MKKVFSWTLRIIAAAILLQTLYFKFTAQPESVEIFTKFCIEPWGRIGVGIGELIASVLLLIPSTVFIGATLGIGLMAGAIMSHLTIIGIVSHGDGGQLFILAIIVMVCCIFILFLHRQQAKRIFNKYFKNSDL